MDAQLKKRRLTKLSVFKKLFKSKNCRRSSIGIKKRLRKAPGLYVNSDDNREPVKKVTRGPKSRVSSKKGRNEEYDRKKMIHIDQHRLNVYYMFKKHNRSRISNDSYVKFNLSHSHASRMHSKSLSKVKLNLKFVTSAENLLTPDSPKPKRRRKLGSQK